MTPPRYRVEHRDGDRIEVVDVAPNRIGQHAARLAARGATGELVVVNSESGRVIIRWPLATVGRDPVPPRTTDGR